MPINQSINQSIYQLIYYIQSNNYIPTNLRSKIKIMMPAINIHSITAMIAPTIITTDGPVSISLLPSEIKQGEQLISHRK